MNSIKKSVDDPVIVLQGDNWHEGIIGIIASRLKDKFNKPTIIISTKDKIKASARSIIGFDIGSCYIVSITKKLLIRGGGHKMAGGFSILEDKIDEFKEFIIKKYNKNIDQSLKKLFISRQFDIGLCY